MLAASANSAWRTERAAVFVSELQARACCCKYHTRRVSPPWRLMHRKGRYNLCPDVKFFATPPVHGSLARYVDHPEDFCFELPGELSYEEGAMIEPLSNGIHACRRAGVEPGKTVAILGAGPMGE